MPITRRILLLLILMSTTTAACSSLFGADPAASIGSNTVPAEWVFLGLPNVQLVHAASSVDVEVEVTGNKLYVEADLIESATIAGWALAEQEASAGQTTMVFAKDTSQLTINVSSAGTRVMVRAALSATE